MSWRHIITFGFVYADPQEISDARTIIKADFDRRYDLIPITAGSRVVGFSMYSKDGSGVDDQIWIDGVVEKIHALHPELIFTVMGAWEALSEEKTWVWEASRDGIKVVRGKLEVYDG